MDELQTSPQSQVEPKAPGLAVAALILGIVGIVGAFIPGINTIAWICPILAIIFGVMAKKQIKEKNLPGKGMATAGIVLGIIAIVLFVIIVVIIGIFLAVFSQSISIVPM